MRAESAKGLPALCACLFLGAPAAAQELPWQVSAGVGAGHEDNVFRAPAGQEVADRYTFATLAGRLDARLGRQHLVADLSLRNSRYDTRHDLDHTAYGGELAWEGSTAGDISWRLSHRTDRGLASYGAAADERLRVANFEESRQLLAHAQLGAFAQWVLGVDVSRREIDYSAPVYAAQAYRLDSVGLGATWEPLRPLSATLRPRFTHGRYPNVVVAGVPSPQAFDRTDVDLALRWVPRGSSTLNARLSATAQHYVEGTARDFDGATGQIDWAWRATGKTRLNVTLSRDTGSESTFFTFGDTGRSFRGVGDNSRLTTSLFAQVDHQLTGKVQLVLAVQETRRRLAVASRLLDPGIDLGGEAGDERTHGVSFGVHYEPTVRSVLGCRVSHERRSAGTALSTPYDAVGAACSAQLSLR